MGLYVAKHNSTQQRQTIPDEMEPLPPMPTVSYRLNKLTKSLPFKCISGF